MPISIQDARRAPLHADAILFEAVLAATRFLHHSSSPHPCASFSILTPGETAHIFQLARSPSATLTSTLHTLVFLILPRLTRAPQLQVRLDGRPNFPSRLHGSGSRRHIQSLLRVIGAPDGSLGFAVTRGQSAVNHEFVEEFVLCEVTDCSMSRSSGG